MKFIGLILLLALSPFLADPVVEWLDEKEHDFGDIVRNKPVVKYFSFKNISGEPITIDNIRSTCGCTAPDWSAAPVEHDSISKIRIEYDARKTGYFRKKIKVFFNSQRKAEVLYVEGYVLERKE